MATSSSAQKPPHLLNPYGGGPTAAPPPTPSTQSNNNISASDAADTLSRLLHRLPPNLSLPTRLSPRAPATTEESTTTTTTLLPIVSLSQSPTTTSPAFETGFFQLAHHSIPSELAESAESEALSLFDLPLDQKLSYFPKEDWPLGFEEEDGDDQTASFCLVGSSPAAAEAELRLSSLRELTRELEKLGLEVVESLACAVGFENPFKNGRVGPSCLMWISEGESHQQGRVYPYVVGLQYQIRGLKCSLLSDSGSVHVEPQIGSVLVTVGDIAQVWSNGKLKKVRGRPFTIMDDGKLKSRCISMTLLVTLPLESIVYPIPLLTNPSREIESEKDQEEGINKYYHQSFESSTSDYHDGNDDDNDQDKRAFNSFSFEDYAWRVYHERFSLKDPLARYRINSIN